jgi:hypothetical protein
MACCPDKDWLMLLAVVRMAAGNSSGPGSQTP